ncbi:aspartate kinase [Mycoplasmatota bacterium WC44]
MIEIIKLGGNTVKNQETMLLAANYIKSKIDNDIKVLIVISAMGRIGDPYATDTLRSLVNGDVSKKELDRLMSCGELISSIVFKSALSEVGVKSYACGISEIGIVTDNSFGDANIISVEKKLIKILKKYDCLVLPGFQGLSEDNFVTTLGRGGSDTTAIVLGELYKTRVEIISDVPGILTADPKIVEGAKLIETISYSQLEAITKNGCNVLHYKAAKLANKAKVPLVFKSIEHPDLFTVVGETERFFNLTYKIEGNKVKLSIMRNDEITSEEINVSELKNRINYLHYVYHDNIR